jgi:hypothetical protein
MNSKLNSTVGTEQLKGKRKSKKFFAILTLSSAGVFIGSTAALAFDFGGLSGLLDTVAPAISQYSELDITKYAGYLKTFDSVLSSAKTGKMDNILSAVGNIHNSLGDSGVVIPSKLASEVLDAVSAKYSSNGRNLSGIGFVKAGDRALSHAQNVSHRAYVESVLGEDGQKNIKEGIQGSGDLVKSSSDLASKGIKATVSQKKFDAMLGQGVINSAGQAKIYGKLTEIQINGAQQTEIQSGILEHLTGDRTAKTLGAQASINGSSQSSGILAGLAGPAPSKDDVAQQTNNYAANGQDYSQAYGLSPDISVTTTDMGVPKF